MISEIVEVLAKIAKAISGNLSPEETVKSIAREKKYRQNVIAAAYSWIYEKILRDLPELKDETLVTSTGFRILSEKEISAIGLKNYNYLLHFHNIGLLNLDELELVLDQIKLLPDENVGEESINILILSLFLDIDKMTLPGSRLLLYSSDNIN
jgi:uncharacterized protein Smg (DUF494 family)